MVEIVVDDIIFEGHDNLCKTFTKEMMDEVEISIFGVIKFFVGLQVNQMKHGIFITQSKYVKEILKHLVWRILSLLAHLW